MKARNILIVLCLFLFSLPTMAQTSCPDGNGNCYLHDLFVSDLQDTPRDSFDCPDGTFVTGLQIASSIQEFGENTTRIIGDSFSIPISETKWEVHYAKPV